MCLQVLLHFLDSFISRRRQYVVECQLIGLYGNAGNARERRWPLLLPGGGSREVRGTVNHPPPAYGNFSSRVLIQRILSAACSLGPFYGAIAVPSVTRCRCCRRCCCGHRCVGGVRQ